MQHFIGLNNGLNDPWLIVMSLFSGTLVTVISWARWYRKSPELRKDTPIISTTSWFIIALCALSLIMGFIMITPTR